MADRIQMETGVTGPDAPVEEVAETTGAERPEWLPEKFESAEAMAQAYGELESKMGTTGEAVEDTTGAEDQTPIEQVESGIGIEAMEQFNQEFAENGDLSDASYETLAKEHGISEELARAHVEGQHALMEMQKQSVFNEVGGEESYTDMIEWAKDNLSEADINAYDEAINSGDMSTVTMVAKGLHAQYVAANGSNPSLVKGNAANSTTNGFQSWQQVSEAMRNPKYANDPAYRQEVSNRLAVSNLQQ